MNRVYVMELVHSLQRGDLTRREFLSQAGLALGSASSAGMLLAACAPGSASAPPVVDSDDAGRAEGVGQRSGETVSYPGEGQTLTGFLARPESEASLPGLVVIQEWWGLNEHIRDVTRRFAQAGFVALAPDLYHGVVVTEPDEARKAVMELDMAAAVREIGAAIQYLQGHGDVAGEKVGVVGFCMGGRLALQAAKAELSPGAVVAFYGAPLTAEEEASMVKAPVLGLYGEADQGIPVERVEAMATALTEAGIENEIKVYEGAGHAFFNDTRAAYHPEAAEDAWERTVEWLQRYLGG